MEAYEMPGMEPGYFCKKKNGASADLEGEGKYLKL